MSDMIDKEYEAPEEDTEEYQNNEFIVDLGGIETPEDMHDRLAASLPLPEYYGGNLDALYDVLTEMGDGWHVVFVNVRDVDEDMVSYVRDMLDVFDDAQGVAGDLTYEVDEEDFDA